MLVRWLIVAVPTRTFHVSSLVVNAVRKSFADVGNLRLKRAYAFKQRRRNRRTCRPPRKRITTNCKHFCRPVKLDRHCPWCSSESRSIFLAYNVIVIWTVRYYFKCNNNSRIVLVFSYKTIVHIKMLLDFRHNSRNVCRVQSLFFLLKTRILV